MDGNDFTNDEKNNFSKNPLVEAIPRNISLHVAAEVGRTDLDKMLEDPEVLKNINVKDKFGRTPLHYAVAQGKVENIAALLEAGASPNIPNARGKTAVNMINQFDLDNPNLQNSKGNTLLHIAAERGYTELVSAFCSREGVY